MKINQIIREKRKELSLTQEQIAELLGVSTPAVNKWEKVFPKQKDIKKQPMFTCLQTKEYCY